MSYIENLEKAIDYIEDNLTEKLTIEMIAEKANYSVYHFSRVFLALTGETPINYLRKRRLSQALLDLVNKNYKVLDLAIKYQFGSQEAFSRSFKKIFKISPSKAKTNKAFTKLIFPKLKFSANNINFVGKGEKMESKIIEKEKLILVGLINNATKNSNFGAYWDVFFKEQSKIKRVNNTTFYGLETYSNDFTETCTWYYMPSVEVETIEEIPSNMFIKVLPKSTYAVFTIKWEFGKNVGKTFDYIFQSWLPNSGYKVGLAFDFEYYDERFDIQNPDSEMDIYIPIIKSEG